MASSLLRSTVAGRGAGAHLRPLDRLGSPTWRSIYFNCAATTWPKPEPVQRAVLEAVSSMVNPGRAAFEGAIDPIERARSSVARFLGANDPSRLAFVPSATWAANCAIQALPWRQGDRVLMSGLEHNACSRPAQIVADRLGVSLGVAPYGTGDPMDLNWVESELRSGRVKLVIANMGSNVTGELLPCDELRQLTRRYGASLMLDATQAAGVLPLHIGEMDPDLAIFAGHKGLHGPPGVGLIYVSPHIESEVWVGGSTGKDSGRLEMGNQMPSKFEIGTPNLPGILGLEAGVEWVRETGSQAIFRHESALASRFLEGLGKLPGVRVYGSGARDKRLPVVSVNFSSRQPQDVSSWLSGRGVVTRAGFHCSPLAHQTIGSHRLGGTVRFSFGFHNTETEVDEVLDLLEEMRSQETTTAAPARHHSSFPGHHWASQGTATSTHPRRLSLLEGRHRRSRQGCVEQEVGSLEVLICDAHPHLGSL